MLPPGARDARALGWHLFPALAIVATLVLADVALAQPPPRNPFAIGGAEAAPPALGSVFGWLLQQQAILTRALHHAVRALRTDPSAIAALAGLAFTYGVVHAAGPGHGKAVIAAYVVANERALRRAMLIALAAAVVQALVAILAVGAVFWVVGGGRAALEGTVRQVELAGFVLVVLFGLWLLVTKGRKLARLMRPAPASAGAAAVADRCGGFHLPPPEVVTGWSRRDAAVAALAAGARPCTGAILLLVLTFSQGLAAAGLAGVAAMALGTALTTAAIAALAVYAKAAALRLAGGARGSAILGAALEVMAGAAILLLGLLLLSGQLVPPGGA